MSLGPFGGPERASGGPFCPRALIWTPPGNRKSASPSCSFPRPRPDPPENPVSLKSTYLQCFLMSFRRTGAPKWPPPGAPRILRRPPGEPKEPPKKRARAPRAQKAPPGPPQGPPGTTARPLIQVSHLNTMFCHTSHVIFIVLLAKLL